MTVNELASFCGFEPLVLPDPEREVVGAYTGDLLSWVMGKAKEDCAFITIMTNLNVLAVASLKELSCVIFAEDAEVSSDVLAAAEQKGINLLRSRAPAFEACLSLGKALGLS